jgi:hypothetical protein
VWWVCGVCVRLCMCECGVCVCVCEWCVLWYVGVVRVYVCVKQF